MNDMYIFVIALLVMSSACSSSAQSPSSTPKLIPQPSRAAVVDSDGDGVPDDRDDCVREAEDFDGVLDKDGCPDSD